MSQERLLARWSRRRTLALAAGGAVLGLAGRPAAAAEAGIVTALRGAATATVDGTTRDLYVGAAVHQQDSIVTAPGGRLQIGLADGSTLVVGEASRLVLSQVVLATDGGGASMVFDLLAGIVRAVLGPSPPELFEVRGRAAVAAARSTEFVVETETSATSVFVARGEVAVSASYGRGDVRLAAGDGIDVVRHRPATRAFRGRPDPVEREAEAIGPVRRWGRGRVDQVMARTTVDP